MYLLRFIKIILLYLLFFSVSSAYSQNDSSTVYIGSPYRTEYNPWYKLSEFKRGFHSDSLSFSLDELDKKPKKEWSHKDSLNFAKASLHSGEIELSEYYFNLLTIDFKRERSFWWEKMMTYVINKNYEMGIETIHKSRPGILEFSKIYFMDKMLQAYIKQEKNNKWYKTNLVLHWEIDSSLLKINKNSPAFYDNVIQPLKNLNFVLKELIHYVHENDPIIAKTCYEMGLIFENYISYSEAYISYSLGRHYNKRDKEILNAVKQVKSELTKRKYKIPNFRRSFPTIEHSRFDYEVLKEKIFLELADTIPKIPPSLMLEKKQKKLIFPSELIIVAGIFVIFLLLLFFLKTKK